MGAFTKQAPKASRIFFVAFSALAAVSKHMTDRVVTIAVRESHGAPLAAAVATTGRKKSILPPLVPPAAKTSKCQAGRPRRLPGTTAAAGSAPLRP